MITVCLCQSLLAGSPADREDEMKRAREKEAGRARDAAENFGNLQDFEKKYESLKENYPAQFAAAVEKRRQAANAWQTAANGIASANSYEQISALKMPAYDAEGGAELARLEMKAAAAEKEWKSSAEKSGSREVAAAAEQMIQNQKAIIQATRQNMSSQRALRQLEIERSNLDQKMRSSYESAKRDQHEKQQKREDKDKPQKCENKDNNSSRDHEKKPSPENKPDPGNDRSGKILVE